jgi:NTP pyrophosphatase (non-canonical NTP hydrolase)
MSFMLKFGHMFLDGHGVPLHLHPTLRRPRHLTKRKAEDRHAQMQEEVDEFFEAMQENDLPKMADALIDLVYFAKGTANLMGLPWDELWVDVHRANMAKERGEKVRGGRAIKVDAIKPPGWQGPRTLEVLSAAGYDVARDRDVAWDDPENALGGEMSASSATSSATSNPTTTKASEASPEATQKA